MLSSFTRSGKFGSLNDIVTDECLIPGFSNLVRLQIRGEYRHPWRDKIDSRNIVKQLSCNKRYFSKIRSHMSMHIQFFPDVQEPKILQINLELTLFNPFIWVSTYWIPKPVWSNRRKTISQNLIATIFILLLMLKVAAWHSNIWICS